MSALVGWLWRWLYRMLCARCQQLLWPWQARHYGNAHTSCVHSEQDRLYARAVTDYDYPVEPWACPDCGRKAVA